jgi:hypothetical protein
LVRSISGLSFGRDLQQKGHSKKKQEGRDDNSYNHDKAFFFMFIFGVSLF